MREVEELLATQLSRNSRTTSIESARTDLPSDDLRPALTALADCYEESGPYDCLLVPSAHTHNNDE